MKFVRALIVMFVALPLIACGSGGGGEDVNPPGAQDTGSSGITGVTRNLTGTVAVGAPVPAVIKIVDRRGDTLVAESNANGKYSANLEGRPGPYLIRIEPHDSSIPVMYSFATSSGVANATPFTTLALFLAFGSGLEAAFNDWVTHAGNWDRKDLEQVLAMINANFSNELGAIAGVDATRFDCFTSPFDADRTGFDAFLDEFTAVVDLSAGSYVIHNSAGVLLNLNESIDTTGYYIGALFVPVDTAIWELTWSQTVNGAASVSSVLLPVGADIPWRYEHLFGDFWPLYDLLLEGEVENCEDDVNVQCDIRLVVTQFDNTFNVIGAGEVGTLVNGTISFGWRVRGWVDAGFGRSVVDESSEWSTGWSWRRVN